MILLRLTYTCMVEPCWGPPLESSVPSSPLNQLPSSNSGPRTASNSSKYHHACRPRPERQFLSLTSLLPHQRSLACCRHCSQSQEYPMTIISAVNYLGGRAIQGRGGQALELEVALESSTKPGQMFPYVFPPLSSSSLKGESILHMPIGTASRHSSWHCTHKFWTYACNCFLNP